MPINRNSYANTSKARGTFVVPNMSSSKFNNGNDRKFIIRPDSPRTK